MAMAGLRSRPRFCGSVWRVAAVRCALRTGGGGGVVDRLTLIAAVRVRLLMLLLTAAMIVLPERECRLAGGVGERASTASGARKVRQGPSSSSVEDVDPEARAPRSALAKSEASVCPRRRSIFGA